MPAGAKLLLVVAEANADRVVLRISDQPQAPPLPPVAVALPLPGGGTARVYKDPDGEGSEGSGGVNRVALVYDSPWLGPLDLLEEALWAAASRPAVVSVTARRDPLDLYA